MCARLFPLRSDRLCYLALSALVFSSSPSPQSILTLCTNTETAADPFTTAGPHFPTPKIAIPRQRLTLSDKYLQYCGKLAESSRKCMQKSLGWNPLPYRRLHKGTAALSPSITMKPTGLGYSHPLEGMCFEVPMMHHQLRVGPRSCRMDGAVSTARSAAARCSSLGAERAGNRIRSEKKAVIGMLKRPKEADSR